MLLAPRHVERAAALGEMFARKGLPFRLRSAPLSGAAPAVTILDTVGELSEAYGLATFAFVGGSFVNRGGQNPLEPARWGVPVFFGPRMENFREMAELFTTESAAVQAPDTKALETELLSLLEDSARAELLGRAARKTAESQRGALEASFTLLSQALTMPVDGGCCDGH
jgi:3-deoxy-D-manno-octulosonic-acid transferase